MDNERFDHWTRTIAQPRSRRGLLGMLATAAAALVTRRRGSAQVAYPGGICGGPIALPCPDGYECVDDPRDSCDPTAGGADCPGICVAIDVNPCAAVLCMEGTTCCPNCGGICIPAGVPCSAELCPTEPCNQATCDPGEYCCNESCSRCVGLGQGCSHELCLPSPFPGEACGAGFCGPGEYCCNESCGICAPLGGGCLELDCEPPAPSGELCGPTVCPPGQVCCNESCGICTPPGGMCIALYCGD